MKLALSRSMTDQGGDAANKRKRGRKPKSEPYVDEDDDQSAGEHSFKPESEDSERASSSEADPGVPEPKKKAVRQSTNKVKIT